MKRSEMIKEVAEIVKPILNNTATFDARLNNYGAKSIVNILLKEFEKRGMLPPCDGYAVGCGDFDTDECTRDHASDCKWENE